MAYFTSLLRSGPPIKLSPETEKMISDLVKMLEEKYKEKK